jgi:hypothetical protein
LTTVTVEFKQVARGLFSECAGCHSKRERRGSGVRGSCFLQIGILRRQAVPHGRVFD